MDSGLEAASAAQDPRDGEARGRRSGITTRLRSLPARVWSAIRRAPARWPVLALLLAAAALVPALALRFWTASPLWLDEAQSVAIAQLPLPEMLEALRRDGAPPLYYALLHLWTGLWGTGDVAVRSLSGLISVASLPLMWWAGVRVGGTRRHGAFAALVLASNPWALRYATEARMYSLVVLLVLVAAVALDATVRRGRTVDVLALGGATGLLLLTHYWSFFLLPVAGVALLVAARRARRTGRSVRGPVRAFVGLAAGGLLFVPWLPSFLFQVRHTGAPWADLPGLSRLATLPVDWSGGTSPPARWLLLVLWPLLLLGVFARSPWSAPAAPGATSPGAATAGPSTGRLSGRMLGALTGGVLLVALVVTRLTGSGIEVRYTAVVIPGVVLLVTLGIFTLPTRWTAPVLAGVVLLGLGAGFDAAKTVRTQAGEVAAALDQRASPGDVVVYCPDQLAPSVERLLQTEGLARLTVPRNRDVAPVNWVDYERRTEATLGDGVASSALMRAGEAEGEVWLLTSPRYRTHQQTCGEVRRGLARRGAKARVFVPLDFRTYEYAVLERWTPGRS